ncbi:amidohydrolase family protein [Lacihabitans sp. LS3-19]|uniref:metal-dependent hydrolase family protein n=1 Tax=Lacihabitans sp. LS3-19 TaxID=2487335 RepID=UPI0020CD16B5|nr:amidohydrolase family protein [Lacihabitans sp. LS3-19]MCP9766281.1 amidohydrolase family protein [Lacihabitans sp. LS3-19]
MKRLLLLLFLVSQISIAQKTYIQCGNLIDTRNQLVLKDMTIVVEGNKIVDVQKGLKKGEKTDVLIDLSKKYVMPGLIDMHVHIESQTAKDQFQKRIQYSEADVAFESQKYARVTLMAGFTTVRDMGGTNVNISLRNAINRGSVIGPRIFTSGKTIATTGGHGDPSNGIGTKLMLPEDASDGVINSAEEARRAVRQRYQDGADWIKITATGGVLSIAKNGKGPQFQDDELEGLISTAKDYGFGVAAHAHGAEGMKRALRAGVTTIEHGSFLDDECIALFKEKGAYLVPTIIAGKTASDSAKIPGYFHPFVVKKALETGVLIQDAFARAYKAGVNICFGTDAGVYPHGYNAKEFLYMTEAGMPIMEALKAATITNAKVLGMDDQLGAIEPGKMADIVAIDEDPAKNVLALMNMSFVMKDGVVYKK